MVRLGFIPLGILSCIATRGGLARVHAHITSHTCKHARGNVCSGSWLQRSLVHTSARLEAPVSRLGPCATTTTTPPSLTSPCQHVTGGSPDVTKMSPKCHQNVTNCHKMSPRCHEMSRDVTRCHEVSRDVTEVSHCHQLSPTVTNCHQTVTKLSPKCHQNVTKCHQVSPSCHQLSPPVTTDHGASRALSV